MLRYWGCIIAITNIVHIRRCRGTASDFESWRRPHLPTIVEQEIWVVSLSVRFGGIQFDFPRIILSIHLTPILWSLTSFQRNIYTAAKPILHQATSWSLHSLNQSCTWTLNLIPPRSICIQKIIASINKSVNTRQTYNRQAQSMWPSQSETTPRIN